MSIIERVIVGAFVIVVGLMCAGQYLLSGCPGKSFWELVEEGGRKCA